MEGKRCTKCRNFKSINCFSVMRGSKDGLRYFCKDCNKNILRVYRKTKAGLITSIYNNQKRSSKHRGHPAPTYTKQELKEWLFNQPLFHELYDNWVNSDYNKWLAPSVDRPDDYKGYSFDNIQLMTFRENNQKGHTDQACGINNKNSKAVLQYDLEGNFIKEYYSQTQAERETGISQGHIGSVCNGIFKTMGGFIWKHKN